MSRELARNRYIELCRDFNLSGRRVDRDRAGAFLHGVAYAIGDGEEVNLYDFCCAADEAAMRDGFESSCWGLRCDPAAIRNTP